MSKYPPLGLMSILNFGKFRGSIVVDLLPDNKQYLEWLRDNTDTEFLEEVWTYKPGDKIKDAALDSTETFISGNLKDINDTRISEYAGKRRMIEDELGIELKTGPQYCFTEVGGILMVFDLSKQSSGKIEFIINELQKKVANIF